MTATRFLIDSSAAPSQSIRLHEITAGERPGATGRAVLFVHGATYPGTMFDVPGASWLARAAADGFDAYAIDIRGYGGSYHPPAMDAPAKQHPPFCRADEAAADIADAVATIQERTGIERIHLVGWSWGTMTTGTYAARAPGTIARLVCFAPVYGTPNAAWVEQLADRDDPTRCKPLGAYRTESRAEADARWRGQITADDPAAWRDPAILDAWYDAMLADEPGKAVRAPNGVLLDLWQAFTERPVYAAGAITVPTMVIRGGADTTATRADALGLFDALGSSDKQYVELAHASHFALLEHRREALHNAVTQFLLADSKQA